MTVVKLSEITKTTWQFLIYGGPGVGKTVFACSSGLRTLVIDVDDGMNSANAFLAQMGKDRSNIDVITVKSFVEFNSAWTHALKNVANYDLIVIDTASELHRLLINYVCKEAGQQAPRIQDWGTIQRTMEQIVVTTRYLPIHVIYTAHEVIKSDGEGTPESYGPSFQGAIRHEILRHFDLIGRFYLRRKAVRKDNNVQDVEAERFIQFGVAVNAKTKDRSNMLSDGPQVPDLHAILEKVAKSTAANKPK